MTINYDCVRAVLIALENHLELDEYLSYVPVEISDIVKFDELKDDYSDKDIAYSVYMLADGGFLQPVSVVGLPPNVRIPLKIETITYKGHEFIEQIKNDTTWNKVKSTAAKVGNFSLSALGNIGVAVAQQLIQNALFPS